MIRSVLFGSLGVCAQHAHHGEEHGRHTQWVHIEMFDTFGDGWNGACCEVSNSHNSFWDQFCLEDGQYGEHGMEIPVGDDVIYYIDCEEGDFPWESAWVAWTEDGGHLNGKLGLHMEIGGRQPDHHECEACVHEFDHAGGCHLWRECEHDPNGCDYERLLSLVPEFCESCEPVAAEFCFGGGGSENCHDCVANFIHHDGGCAIFNPNIDADEMMELHHKIPECLLHGPQECWETAFEECWVDIDCAMCVQQFNENGGCRAFVDCDDGDGCAENQWDEMMNAIPDGCDAEQCYTYAQEVCWSANIDCELCVSGFADAGGCRAWQECGDDCDEDSFWEYLPRECHTDNIEICGEMAEHVCFGPDRPDIDCHRCVQHFEENGGCGLIRNCERSGGHGPDCNPDFLLGAFPEACQSWEVFESCGESMFHLCIPESLPETEENCNACVNEFYMDGGCAPLRQCEEAMWMTEHGCDQGAIMNAVPERCHGFTCTEAIAYDMCFGDEAQCTSCVTEFAMGGGCELWHQCEENDHEGACSSLVAMIPTGCHHCEGEAFEQCFSSHDDICYQCERDFWTTAVDLGVDQWVCDFPEEWGALMPPCNECYDYILAAGCDGSDYDYEYSYDYYGSDSYDYDYYGSWYGSWGRSG